MNTIKIQVDSDTAQAYNKASKSQKEKISYLIKLFLHPDFIEKSLTDVMTEIADNAEKRGLTPEILQSILDEEN